MEWIEGWGEQLPTGSEQISVYVKTEEIPFLPLFRNAAGDYGLNGIEITDEAEILLSMAEKATGWNLHSGPSDFTGLVRLELMYGNQVLLTVTDGDRLKAFEDLMKNGIRASYPSKTPNEWVELRCVSAQNGEEKTASLVLDPEEPRFWLPPCLYYRYNAYESTGVLPILNILGLEDWPEELKSGSDSDTVIALYERLAPVPRPLWGEEELLFRLPVMDWAEYANRVGSGEAVRRIYGLAQYVQEQELSETNYSQILAGAGRTDGALAEAYDFLLAKLFERDPVRYASCWALLNPQQQKCALPVLSWGTDEETAEEKVKVNIR